MLGVGDWAFVATVFAQREVVCGASASLEWIREQARRLEEPNEVRLERSQAPRCALAGGHLLIARPEGSAAFL